MTHAAPPSPSLPSTALLDNLFWHSLVGPHALRSVGTATVRRLLPGFSPIAAFADPAAADLDGLRPFCEPGETLTIDGWTGAPPPGWRVLREAVMLRMVWRGAPPEADHAPGVVTLEADDLAQVMALMTLTKPGPFGPRTIELGDYFGCYEGTQLVAMAGERMHAGPWREISGVCVHPDHQGRGLARRLMLIVMRHQMARGQTPCLNVLRQNASACALYERMGFHTHGESLVRVVARD